MEWINLLIILISIGICSVWALTKRFEINSTRVEIDASGTYSKEEQEAKKQEIFYDEEDLRYVAKTCQKIINGLLRKMHNFSLLCIAIMTLFVWVFMEEKGHFIQPFLFFSGAYIQILNVFFVFNNYKFFDPRVVFINRASPKHALEFVIKVNSYVTMTNQVLNMLVFFCFYFPYISFALGTNENAKKRPTADFEYVHRKFIMFGFGSVFTLFTTKSLSHLFCQGSKIAYEILHRDKGIDHDHPRNPARILSNISESFFRSLQNTMEYNALTNMGLCLFQDFFVIKYVYIYDAGFLNGIAIYCLGMVGSLLSMINFRYFSYFKFAETKSFFTSVKQLRMSGMKAILLSGLFILIGSFFILFNTFPDSVSVYNPFRRDIAMRGVKYFDVFIIICTSFVINLALVINSIYFTDPLSHASKSLQEFSKVSLTNTFLDSKFYSYLGMLFPSLVWLGIMLSSYHEANVFGISINYMGCITFYQIIQFFGNFKYMHNFYTTILMMNKERVLRDEMKGDVNIINLTRTCIFYGKFATGTSLFISKIMIFTILVDCFNMNIVGSILLVKPYELIAIFFGCQSITILCSLELSNVDYFVQQLINRTREFVIERLEELHFEPPVLEISQDLARSSFFRLFFMLYLPVSLPHPVLDRSRRHLLALRRTDDQPCPLWQLPLGTLHLLPLHPQGRDARRYQVSLGR